MTARDRSDHPCRGAGSKGPRRSRATRWRAAVLIGVHVAIGLHVLHWWRTGRTLSPLEPSEGMELARRSVVNAGLVFFGLAALSTLVLGRWFCGWGCHLVALQDLCRALLLRLGIRPRALRSRALAWVPTLAFLYMFVWPAVSRMLQGHATPPVRADLQTVDFWRTFPPLWGAIVTFLVCGFAAVWFLGSKGFCTYACPYGALFGAVDRLAPLRIRVTDACEGCGHCTATCTSNVAVAREVRDHGMVVDPGCMKCMDCVSVCPKDALFFGAGRPALGLKRTTRPRGLGWREEAGLSAAFATTFLALRGLYGAVPLLLALGLAGCAAAMARTTWRLAGKKSTGIRALDLPRRGARAAWWMLAAASAAFLVHSAVVQVEGRRAARHFAHLEGPRSDWFSRRRAPLDEDQLGHARSTIVAAERALAWSLLPDARREVELAWARLLTGDGPAFVVHQERAIATGGRPSIQHLELGNHLREQGDLAGAAEHYALALDVDPTLDFAYAMLVDVLTALGRTSEAEPLLRRGLLALPRDLELRALLADLLARTERGAEAIAILEEGVRAAPEEAAPLRVLAFAHLTQGRPAEAREVCERAQALPDPDGETARLAELIRRALLDPAQGSGK